MLRELGALIILVMLTTACIIASVIGWATGWHEVGMLGLGAFAAGCGMIWWAKRKIRDWRGDEQHGP